MLGECFFTCKSLLYQIKCLSLCRARPWHWGFTCNMVIPLISRVMYECLLPHQTRYWDWQHIYPVWQCLKCVAASAGQYIYKNTDKIYRGTPVGIFRGARFLLSPLFFFAYSTEKPRRVYARPNGIGYLSQYHHRRYFILTISPPLDLRRVSDTANCKPIFAYTSAWVFSASPRSEHFLRECWTV